MFEGWDASIINILIIVLSIKKMGFPSPNYSNRALRVHHEILTCFVMIVTHTIWTFCFDWLQVPSQER